MKERYYVVQHTAAAVPTSTRVVATQYWPRDSGVLEFYSGNRLTEAFAPGMWESVREVQSEDK